MIWRDIICDIIWYYMTLYVIWYDIIWHYMWYDMIWRDIICDMIWYDMILYVIWYDIILYYMWYDLIWSNLIISQQDIQIRTSSALLNNLIPNCRYAPESIQMQLLDLLVQVNTHSINHSFTHSINYSFTSYHIISHHTSHITSYHISHDWPICITLKNSFKHLSYSDKFCLVVLYIIDFWLLGSLLPYIRVMNEWVSGWVSEYFDYLIYLLLP